MSREISKPLSELPTFLSTISMVGDDRSAIIQSLIRAELKSPPRYEPTKDLFFRVLAGDLGFREAFAQARILPDVVERKCAVDVLQASEAFLRGETPARTGLFPTMSYSLPNGLKLSISPVWLRHFDPERLMLLHFWQTPLSAWQLSAVAAVLRKALLDHRPQYSGCELDFISVSLPETASLRRFERYGWSKLKPLSDEELGRFWKPFCSAWSDYQKREPREIKRKRERSLFD